AGTMCPTEAEEASAPCLVVEGAATAQWAAKVETPWRPGMGPAIWEVGEERSWLIRCSTAYLWEEEEGVGMGSKAMPRRWVREVELFSFGGNVCQEGALSLPMEKWGRAVSWAVEVEAARGEAST